MSGTAAGSLQDGTQLHSPVEVAKALGCSEWWVKEQARRRRIPFTWIGGSYRFTAEHVREIIRVFEVRPNVDGAPGDGPVAGGSSREWLGACRSTSVTEATSAAWSRRRILAGRVKGVRRGVCGEAGRLLARPVSDRTWPLRHGLR